MKDFTALAEAGGPVFGDQLRLGLYAARMHPDTGLRDEILTAFDKSLGASGARPLSESEITTAILRAVGTPLEPMTFTQADVAVLARLLPACRAAGWGDLFLGSADAVGQGYGAWISGDLQATYHSREDRLRFNNDRSALNLGLLPMRSCLAPTPRIKARFETSQKKGVSIRLLDTELAKSPLASGLHSFISIVDPGRGMRTLALERIGLVVDVHGDEVSIAPRASEAAIRFASICATGAFMCLGCTERPGLWNDAVLIELTSFGTEPRDLPAEWWSCRGLLAEWIHTPVLPIGLDLKPEIRSRIAEWFAEASVENGVTAT